MAGISYVNLATVNLKIAGIIGIHLNVTASGYFMQSGVSNTELNTFELRERRVFPARFLFSAHWVAWTVRNGGLFPIYLPKTCGSLKKFLSGECDNFVPSSRDFKSRSINFCLTKPQARQTFKLHWLVSFLCFCTVWHLTYIYLLFRAYTQT